MHQWRWLSSGLLVGKGHQQVNSPRCVAKLALISDITGLRRMAQTKEVWMIPHKPCVVNELSRCQGRLSQWFFTPKAGLNLAVINRTLIMILDLSLRQAGKSFKR